MTSCDPVIQPPTEVLVEFKPEIIWQKKIGSTLSELFLYKNNVISSYDKGSKGDKGFLFYDKFNGEAIENLNADFFIIPYNAILVDNILHYQGSKYAHTLNLESKTFTNHDYPLYQRINVFDGKLYTNRFDFDAKKYGFYTASSKQNSLNWEILFLDSLAENLEVKPIGSQSIHNIGVKKNEKGDHVIYYCIMQEYIPDTNKFQFNTRQIINAFNATTKKFEWQTIILPVLPSWDRERDARQFDTYFYKNQIITCSSRVIRSFDAKTGHLLWERIFNNLQLSGFSIIENHVYVIDNPSGFLHKIDVESGKSVATINSYYSYGQEWVDHKGIIYITSGKYIQAIDTKTFKIKWTWKSPTNDNDCSQCVFSVPKIDEQTNRMYLTDQENLYCIKIPD